MPKLPYNTALAKMRRSARLLKVSGLSRVRFSVVPGGEVADDTAAKLIDHPQVYSEHDGLLPDCEQSWRFVGHTKPIRFVMHNVCPRCGSNRAVSIGNGNLRCASCKSDRGKLSDLARDFVNATIGRFGDLDSPVQLRRKQNAHDN
jgi:hypothetical protein